MTRMINVKERVTPFAAVQGRYIRDRLAGHSVVNSWSVGISYMQPELSKRVHLGKALITPSLSCDTEGSVSTFWSGSLS
jgi:hypothetical protein